MTYLYETPDPSIHGVLLPELDDWSEFDFGIFFMDDINTPQTLRHRPGLPSCKCHGFGINFYGPCPEDRDERNEPPSNEQRRYDESIFRRGEQHVAQRTPFTAQYQEFWADTMDNDIEDELEFSSNYLLSSAPGRQVHLTCHRTRWVIYKEGQFITANEGIALHNARRQGLPVPRIFCREKLYAAFRGDEDIYSIKMSYIPGRPLTKTWVTLTHDEKIDIMAQVRNMLLHLTIPDEAPNMIGSCDGLEIRDSRIVNTHFAPVCHDEREFNKWMVTTIASAPPDVRRDYHRKLNSRKHRIVFCHGDLSPDNIIINEYLKVVGLIDWEDAGYYPEYWENLKFYGRPAMVPEWHKYGKYILPSRYDDEVHEYLEVQQYQAP